MGLNFIILTLSILFVSTAMAFDFGVNIHGGGGSATPNQTIADIMKSRNLKTARMDYWDGMNVSAFRDQVQKIRNNGGRVEVVLQVSFQWDHSCNQNYSYIEQNSYNQTVTLVNQIKDLVHDFELLNETQLRPEIKNEVPWNTVGTSASAYVGKPCVATLAAALRGMSRAIRDLRNSSGLPLKTILGVVGRDFGFLTFMEQQGVLFDITGYHIYPHAYHTSLLSDPWYGTGGPLAQLAKFNRPVRINEFHCGEIYDADFVNSIGSPSMEQCLRSLDKHLTDLKNQNIINLESVHIYELFDEPQKAAPENRFGLMFDALNPKINLYVISAFAGGHLTASEQAHVTSRGLLTDAEIAQYKADGGQTTPSYQLTLSSPASGATVSGSVNIQGTGPGFQNVEIFSSTGVMLTRVTPDSSGAFSANIDTTKLVNGSQTLTIMAWDSPAGQAFTHTDTETLSLNVQNNVVVPDTQAPSVVITSPTNNSSFKRGSRVTVTANASDNVGVVHVQFFINGSLVCTDTTATYQCRISLPRTRRINTIEVRAQDKAGNIGRQQISVVTR